jgi:nucleotide-binding universal stress UspA family protein
MTGNGPTLIGYDGSDGAKAAIAEAGKVLGGGQALVVSVWQTTASGAPAGLLTIPLSISRPAYEDLDRESEQQARGLADEGAVLAREAGFEATARPTASQTNVWSTLVTLADDERAAAVVVGSRGRSAIASALLGSVSHGVVNHCRRPVLLIPPAH